MQKLGKVVGINEEMLNYTILNGFKTHVANSLTKNAPRNTDELLAAAGMDELTISATRDYSLHAKVDKLMSSSNKMHHRIRRYKKEDHQQPTEVLPSGRILGRRIGPTVIEALQCNHGLGSHHAHGVHVDE